MKKLISALLTSLIILSFCACSPKDNGTESSNTAQNESIYSNVEAESQDSGLNSDNTSQTQSSGVVQKINNFVEFGVYHFQPHWTTHYGTASFQRLEEFEDVIKQGYFNSFIISPQTVGNYEMWEIVKKYDLRVWLSLYSYYDSRKQTLDSYMNTVEGYYQQIAVDKERLKYFQGFIFDEPIYRGGSNADFLAATEALYKKYGKRINVVEGVDAFINWRSEKDNPDINAYDVKRGHSDAFKYVTDIGFDHYWYDIREGAQNGGEIENYAKNNKNITDAKSFYKENIRITLEATGGNKNVWVWSCAYATDIRGGLNGIMRADEDYCLELLDFYDEVLRSQKHQGGLYGYTYINSTTDAEEVGLSSKLVVKVNGEQKLLPEHKDKWVRYSNRLKELCKQYRNTEAVQVEY